MNVATTRANLISNTGFAPDAARGRRVDAAVRAGLADSIDHLIEAARESGRANVDLGALCAAIRTHAVRPGVMLLYSDLVPALADDRQAEWLDIFAALGRPEWRDRPSFRVVTLDDSDVGIGMAPRYAKHFQEDGDAGSRLAAVTAERLDPERDRLLQAMALLETAHPALAAEIGALVNEVVLVASSEIGGGAIFHGASSFYAWGALALNPAAHGTPISLVEGLAHEAGHCLLHGLTLGAPLTENAAAERYPSPLRRDARPMEGLVHAAYVLARMHVAMAAVERSTALPIVSRELAGQYRTNATEGFAAALSTITAHGRFNRLGAEIFSNARTYMTATGVCGPVD